MMVRNAEGELLTPSIVLFSNREVVVGKDARTACTTNPEEVVEWVKRDMGAAAYHRPIHGEYLPPEVIQACILRKLRTDLAETFGGDTRAVITVPAYFDEPRRKATADAGEMAGLKVLDIVNEPTAAALAFAEAFGYLSSSGDMQQPMTALVYDLGGGTFDATLLELAPGNVRTIATDGDVQLGGHDWDARLVDHLAEQFLAAYGVDPRQDPVAVNRLLAVAVEAKHTLSVRTRAPLRFEHGGNSLTLEITREFFEQLTSDLLERTAYTIRQLITEAQLDWSKVDRVLLVGGSTRIPAVSAMLEQVTGITPDRTVNPDEAVARGAALFAGYLLAKGGHTGQPAAFEVTNVNSHSLGVEGIEPETLRKTNVILISRNTPLPAELTRRFQTKKHNQRSIVVQVLEGESSMPGECTAIGRTVIRELPEDLPQGWPIEVTFRYGTNGRLDVKAVVPGTHRAADLVLERSVGLSGEGIAHWKSTVTAAAGFATFRQTASQAAGPPPPGPGEASASMPPATAAGSSSTSGATPPGNTAPNRGAAGGPPPLRRAVQPVGNPARGNTPPEIPPAASPAATAAEAAEGVAPGLGGATKSSQMVHVVGLVVSALVGLGLGYLVLTWIRPDTFPPPW